MKKNIKISIRTGVVAMASVLACYSCSDTWDDHYDSNIGGMKVDSTIYQLLKADPDYSDFVRVIDTTGYDALLDETQIITVFAPKNGFNVDSLMNEIKEGNKDLVITRFVKNHIARYNYSSNSHEQTLSLLNKKNTVLNQRVVSADSIKVAAAEILCNNGILHKLEGVLPFHPNIYEEMEVTDGMDSIYKNLSFYDNDSLDVGRSVYRGVDEDGNRIYVDSVIINSNKLMTRLDAYVQREDSNYMAIIPSNEAYMERYNTVKGYFNYNIHENDRDSLQSFYANYYTLNTLLYNRNTNLYDNDSLVTTTYSKYDPDYYVFYNPYEEGGILAPGSYKSKVECSNGIVYTTDKFPTSIYDAFFHDIEVEAEFTGNVNNDESTSGNALYTKNCTYSVVSAQDSVVKVSERAYLDVKPSSSSAQPYIAYNIPNTLAGTYDMYLVTVPLKYGVDVAEADSLKPYQFRVNMFYRTNRATETGSSWPTSKNETLKNPIDGGQNFISDPEKVDTIYLGTKTFTECYRNASNVGVMLQIQAYVSSSQTKNYSRRMLLDRIIFRPSGMPDDEYQAFKEAKDSTEE